MHFLSEYILQTNTTNSSITEVYLYPTVDLVLVLLLIAIIMLYVIRRGILYPIIGIFILIYARLYTPIFDTAQEYSGLIFFGFLLLFIVMIIYELRRGGG